MGYAHIDNLYKDTTILMFKEVFAMEKIHGTSAHVRWDPESGVGYFSGGEKHEAFVALFDNDALSRALGEKFPSTKAIIYGEAYGGKQQGMRHTYGDALRFIAFDVRIGNVWLSVPNAHALCESLGFDFVDYARISTDIAAIDNERDRPSVQAKRNGIAEDRPREGVVLRPVIEVRMNNGDRIVAKHKADSFKETKTPRVIDPGKMKVIEDAKAIADEWVTPMRLSHVLDKMPHGTGMENMRDVIAAMTEDVLREGKGEIVETREALKEIGAATARMFKQHLQAKLATEQ